MWFTAGLSSAHLACLRLAKWEAPKHPLPREHKTIRKWKGKKCLERRVHKRLRYTGRSSTLKRLLWLFKDCEIVHSVLEWSYKPNCLRQETKWKICVFTPNLDTVCNFFFACLCYIQAVQQNLPGQRQLWPDVLRPWLQPIHREASGALPLQVPLVLLRDLQEVRADRGEIRVQMSPRPRFRLTKALQYREGLLLC